LNPLVPGEGEIAPTADDPLRQMRPRPLGPQRYPSTVLRARAEPGGRPGLRLTRSQPLTPPSSSASRPSRVMSCSLRRPWCGPRFSSLSVLPFPVQPIRLLGMASAGYLAAPDNGGAPLYGVVQTRPITGDCCLAVPLNAAESPVGENLRGGKRLRLRFWKGWLVQHTYPFALNRPPIVSLQLCSPVLVFPLDVSSLALLLVG
jgi:hypothetical protein